MGEPAEKLDVNIADEFAEDAQEPNQETESKPALNIADEFAEDTAPPAEEEVIEEEPAQANIADEFAEEAAPPAEEEVIEEEPAQANIADEFAEDVTEAVVEPVAEAVIEPVAEPVAEAVVEPVAEPVAAVETTEAPASEVFEPENETPQVEEQASQDNVVEMRQEEDFEEKLQQIDAEKEQENLDSSDSPIDEDEMIGRLKYHYSEISLLIDAIERQSVENKKVLANQKIYIRKMEQDVEKYKSEARSVTSNLTDTSERLSKAEKKLEIVKRELLD